MKICDYCKGNGFLVIETTGYEHHPNCDGSCILCPVPVKEQEQEPCYFCGGSGHIQEETEKTIDLPVEKINELCGGIWNCEK